MMEGDPRINKLMLPVLAAIDRHVKDSDAKTEIYNRAYEAIMISMEANEPSRSDVSVTGNVLTDIKTSNSVKSDGSEAAEAKVAELEAAAKRFKQIIDEIGSKVAELREAVRWIPVTERLPELGVLVLVAQRDKYGSTFGQLWHDDVWLVYDKRFSDQKYWVYPETYHSVTHWMPLPTLPQEDVK